jgi:hypothetical protein
MGEENILTADRTELMTCKHCKHCQINPNSIKCLIRTTHDSRVNQDTKLESGCSNWEERDNSNETRDIFDKIKLIIREYVDMKEEYYTLIALWILGTWNHNKFETFPFLFINAMKGTAKSRTLKLIAALENNGEYVNSLTEAVLFRQNNPLGIDEFEGLGGRDKQALRELLNSAYKKGAKVKRMKKVKSIDGETQEVQTFDLYRPIHMANIWGMEEVLGDRCITIILEKSQNKGVTKLMENFSDFPLIQEVKAKLNEISVVRCSSDVVSFPQETELLESVEPKFDDFHRKQNSSVVSLKNIYMGWHNYIKLRYTPNYIIHITTDNYTKLHPFFDKIDSADIDGRNLELFFPLFLIARMIGEDVLEEVINISKSIVEERRTEEITESKDVMMFEFVAQQTSGDYYKIKELTTMFRLYVHDDEQDNPWLNTKWVGRSLKRLQLVAKKRRTAEGIEVLLNVEKAKSKMEMFK